MNERVEKNNNIACSRMPREGSKMKHLVKRSFTSITAFSLMTAGLMLAGCNGSGGTTASGTPTNSGASSAKVVSGIAAVGEPMSGQVDLRDSSSPSKQRSTVIDKNGLFAIDVTGMKAPFILQGNGSARAQSYKLHSFAEGTGVANINPLSNAMVASASETGDSEEAYNHPDSDKMEKMRDHIQISVGDLLVKIRPLLKRFNADGHHPMKDHFKADHHDLDGMFDYVIIKIENGILTITNKKTGAIIFTGSVKDIKNGHFTDHEDDDLPETPAMPTAPLHVSALGGTGQVTLSWDAVSNATGYNVYYASTPGVTTATGTKIADVAAPFVQSGLSAGTTYYYLVTALNSAGEGVASLQASATTSATEPIPTVPAIPTDVIATGGTNQVTLSWGTVSSATSYNAYYSTTSGVTTATGTKISNITTPAVLGSLLSATTYYYVITAVNATGEGAASIQVAAATLADTPAPTVPAVPSAVTAVGGTKQATITWPAVTGAASYNVYRSTTAGVTTTSGTKVAGVTSPYINTGLSAGTTYYFIVSAVNSVGESAASTQTTATTAAAQLAVPAVPTGVTAAGGAKQVALSWSAVTGATSYNIYWSSTSGVTTSGTKIATATTAYVQTGLTAGTTYYYIVSAVNSSGEGTASTQMSATTTSATQACGSCHAIPPTVGSHSPHSFTTCATCHGTGYSSTTVNAATHMNGAKDVTNSIWNATTRSCASSCHGARSW